MIVPTQQQEIVGVIDLGQRGGIGEPTYGFDVRDFDKFAVATMGTGVSRFHARDFPRMATYLGMC